MGDVADDMMDEAMRWAYDSEVCENGHRYIDDGHGCWPCELAREEAGMGDMADWTIENGLLAEWLGEDPDYEEDDSMSDDKYLNVSGAIFPNDNREKDTHPHGRGKIEITEAFMRKLVEIRRGGRLPILSIAMWKREPREGKKGYMSLSVGIDEWAMDKRDEELGLKKDEPASKPAEDMDPFGDPFGGESKKEDDPFGDDPFA